MSLRSPAATTQRSGTRKASACSSSAGAQAPPSTASTAPTSTTCGRSPGAGGAWSWTQLQPQGTPPPPRWRHSAVWDPEEQRMLVFGGEGEATFGDTWSLGWGGGAWTWSQLEPEGTLPGPHSRHPAVWDGESRQMLVYMGSSPWSLSSADGVWTWTKLAPSGSAPLARTGSSAVWDADGRRMLVFGGRVTFTGAGSTFLDDTWALQRDGDAWTWSKVETPPLLPTHRAYHGAAWDRSRGRMIVVGGLDAASGAPRC
ncbi:MAG: hypothetical protein H6744_09160 [Deltaproteobacteria bacterium]|nr:hypothetical protein [Deltaproteobacteria bacterium]